MALEYTEEKLNSLDKETIIQLFLVQQEQLKQIDHQFVTRFMPDMHGKFIFQNIILI